jgi:putative ABC transport system permease protein
MAILALALGIGASAATLSLAYHVLLKPLPYHDAGRLVRIYEKRPKQGRIRNVVSSPDFLDWRKQNRVFDGIAAVTGVGFTYAGSEGPENLIGAQGTAELFRVLGVKPALGRDFLPGEDQTGKSQVVILTHGLWQRRFGGDPGIVGKHLQLSDKSYQVIGVLPNVPAVIRPVAELWVPLVFRAEDSRSQHYLDVYGRLKAGVSFEQARTEMDVIAARLEKEHPQANKGHGASVFPLQQEVVGGIENALILLLVAVGLLLLIACANVANLMLAYMAKRRREIAVRKALGAGTLQIARQFLAESTALAVAGGAAGSLLAAWSLALIRWAEPQNVPRLAEVTVDWRIVVFALGIASLSTVIFGLAPALFAARTNANEVLKDAQRGLSGKFARDPLKTGLVSLEVAIAMVLAIGSGLLFKSFARLASVDPGFKTDNALTATLVLNGTRYREPPAVRQFFETLTGRLENLPGVVSVSAAHALPLSGMDSGYSFLIEGRPPVIRADSPNARYRVVTPNYFRTAGIAILAGRPFEPKDHQNAADVVVINESLARQYWPDEDAVGKRITLIGPQRWRVVVGVVADVKHYGPAEAARGELYFPFAQQPETLMTFIIRTEGAAGGNLLPAIRREVANLDPQQPILRVRPWDEYVDENFALRRFYTSLVAAFSFIALTMAALGIYGVISYTVGLRTREIGIRMALGARAGNVQWMIVRQALQLAAIGIAAGIAGAFALSRTLSGLLYGVAPGDGATIALVIGLLTAVAATASYIPVRRATTVDALRALHVE